LGKHLDEDDTEGQRLGKHLDEDDSFKAI